MTTTTTTFRCWQDLPFPEIWCADTEFYPGAGFANGGVDGDLPTPLCLVAHEMRSGRTVRLWQDELGRSPPYPLGGDALFVAYMNSAEFGTHLALSWGQPACSLDLYIEFRHLMNDGAVKSGERQKGFYSLDGALRHFGDDLIDTALKDDMRDRILQGPPFTFSEQRKIIDYCETDVVALTRLLRRLVQTIRSLPQAMFRARYQWAMASQERRGVPIDLPRLTDTRREWPNIQADLVREKDGPFGCYEFDKNGKPHWSTDQFRAYLANPRRRGDKRAPRRPMDWPPYPSGQPILKSQVFREMAGRCPHIEQLRELRDSISKLRLNDLSVGNDGRNRCLLGAYGTKTARNAPSNSQFVFGPAKWIRFYITPPPGLALVHRDFSQQEVRIAAVLSGDTAMLAACESGDVYIATGEQIGVIRPGMSDTEIDAARNLMKTVVLGISYGMEAFSLALRTGKSIAEAEEILARMRARYPRYEAFVQRTLDHAGLDLELRTQLGWYMQCPPHINERTVRNFPMQSTGAEIQHVTRILAERRGIGIVAPVHDALMAQGPVDCIEDVSTALDRCMRDASAVVLRGYELPTDKQIRRPGERFYDKRGASMWETVNRLLERCKEKAA
jgi:hypothetical protein